MFSEVGKYDSAKIILAGFKFFFTFAGRNRRNQRKGLVFIFKPRSATRRIVNDHWGDGRGIERLW